MDDFLKPVRTTRKASKHLEEFESLSLKDGLAQNPAASQLNKPVLDLSTQSAYGTPNLVSSQQVEPRHSTPGNQDLHDISIFREKRYLNNSASSSHPDQALEILKAQPGREDLEAVLSYLKDGVESKHAFNIHLPGPQTSQLVNTLVTVTIPDQWHNLRPAKLTMEEKQIKNYLLSCLRSVAGLGALVLQIRNLMTFSNQNTVLLEDTISVLTSLLQGHNTLERFIKDGFILFPKDMQRRVFWQEVIALLAGSKILSICAQAFTEQLDSSVDKESKSWLCERVSYVKWLANNSATASTSLGSHEPERWTMLAQFIKRGLSLDRVVFTSEFYSSLLLGSKPLWEPLRQVLQSLSPFDQKMFFDSILQDLTRKCAGIAVVPDISNQQDPQNQKIVRGVAAMVAGVIQSNSILNEHMMQGFTNTNGVYAALNLNIRRALIAILAANQEMLSGILHKSLVIFSDKTQIQHSSILQQEAIAQNILLLFGYLYRLDAGAAKKLSQSSSFLQVVSNRLPASVSRVRLLGMYVGVAVSRIVDIPGNVLNFDIEEMNSDDAKAWFNLIRIEDRVGEIGELKQVLLLEKPTEVKTKLKALQPKVVPRPATAKIISIEEVESDTEMEDEDLVPYEKPDDDPSDSEEDPTLIDRSKPAGPVYISELVRQLQSNNKPEIVEMALENAAALIRRKADFGTELSENISSVTSALINLQEGMSNREMQKLRINALIACLVSKPEAVGPWAASIYFEGDFSLTQRATLLTMLGLGARELAGHEDESPHSDKFPFPSKRLPPQLAAVYAPVNDVALKIEHATMQSMALAAADKATGPDILKVRTFSSRMEVQKKAAQKSKERSRRIPKNLHKMLAESLYLPLCCRMSIVLTSHTNFSASTIFEPNIFRLFLQSLTILITALGSHASQLPIVSRETFTLLSALHVITKLAQDPVILPALLQLLLTTIDLNIEAGSVAEERLVTDFGTMISELIIWAGNLGDVVSIPETRDDQTGGLPWTVLVAGIQVKWHEVGRKFQGRMLGLTGSEMDTL